MIKRLHIAGFKSILSDLDLELAPLTILTGTNSSGKSTILQSILLLKQTVENPTKSIQLVLNGRYAKLGRVQDVRANAGRPITLGFEADVVDDRNTGIEKAEAVAIRLEYGATVSDEIENIFPNAQSICIRPSNDSDWHKILKSKGVPANSLCTISISSDGLAHYKFNYTLATKAGNDTRIRKVHRQQNMIGVELNSFLPKRFHVVENIWDKVTRARLRDLDELDLPKEVLSDIAQQFNRLVGKRPDLFNPANKSPYLPNFVSYIKRLEHYDPTRVAFTRFENLLRGVDKRQVKGSIDKGNDSALSLFENLARKILMAFYKGRKNELRLLHELHESNTGYRIAKGMLSAAESLQRTLESATYLGPLRENPKLLYPGSDIPNPRDVGTKGEYTSFAMGLHDKRSVTCSLPEDLDALTPVDRTEPALFPEALSKWLKYIGVATSARGIPAGDGSGYKIDVRLSGERSENLPNVGVGVSQVLPILVSALLSREKSVLIYEQPELHLHPKTQAMLADFFFSLTLTGRQCIIETHSEHIVNRLRYLAARHRGDVNPISRDTAIYFASKENEQSQYKKIPINQFGDIEEWPKDFFDQNSTMVMNIFDEKYKKKSETK